MIYNQYAVVHFKHFYGRILASIRSKLHIILHFYSSIILIINNLETRNFPVHIIFLLYQNRKTIFSRSVISFSIVQLKEKLIYHLSHISLETFLQRIHICIIFIFLLMILFYISNVSLKLFEKCLLSFIFCCLNIKYVSNVPQFLSYFFFGLKKMGQGA